VKTARWMRLGLGVSLLLAVGVHAVRFAESYQWPHVWAVSACFVVAGLVLVVRPLLALRDARSTSPHHLASSRP